MLVGSKFPAPPTSWTISRPCVDSGRTVWLADCHKQEEHACKEALEKEIRLELGEIWVGDDELGDMWSDEQPNDKNWNQVLEISKAKEDAKKIGDEGMGDAGKVKVWEVEGLYEWDDDESERKWEAQWEDQFDKEWVD